MSNLKPDFDTPLPGRDVPSPRKATVIKQFLAVFRVFPPGEVPSNIPTACLIKGSHDLKILSDPTFRARKNIYFYLESGDVRENDVLRICDALDLIQYVEQKEPWQDHDICAFDDTMAWCLAVTHNHSVTYLERRPQE